MTRVKVNTIAVLILVLISCAPKTVPPELKPAYTSLQVLQRVQELQNLTISLNDSNPPGITKERANLIVKFTVGAAEVLKDSKVGWQESIKKSWTILKDKIKQPENSLVNVWTIVDTMIGAL